MAINTGLRVAVVGAGYWGPKHVRVLHGTQDVDEVVLVDGRPDRLASLARNYPGDRACASLREALPHVDAVVIATPPSTHLPLAMAAIEAGRHVLVEKPLAPRVADARRLVAAADDAGVTLMVGHTFEYNPAVQKLRDLIQRRELGDLYYLDSARLNLGLYQSDVNVIFDLAPHDVSIINYVLGTPPVAVQAWGARHAHPRFEDVAYLRLFYEDHGIAANIHVSWLDPGKVRRVVAVGSRKMAVYDDLAEERIRVLDKGVDPPPPNGNATQPPMSYRYGDIVSPFLAPDEPLAVQDGHFVECALTGKTARTDGRNGLAVVEALEAAQLSLRLGHPVLLEELSADSRLVDDLEAPARFVAVSVPWYRRDRSGAALIREGA